MRCVSNGRHIVPLHFILLYTCCMEIFWNNTYVYYACMYKICYVMNIMFFSHVCILTYLISNRVYTMASKYWWNDKRYACACSELLRIMEECNRIFIDIYSLMAYIYVEVLYIHYDDIPNWCDVSFINIFIEFIMDVCVCRLCKIFSRKNNYAIDKKNDD